MMFLTGLVIAAVGMTTIGCVGVFICLIDIVEIRRISGTRQRKEDGLPSAYDRSFSLRPH
jgi:hypothetical protein